MRHHRWTLFFLLAATLGVPTGHAGKATANEDAIRNAQKAAQWVEAFRSFSASTPIEIVVQLGRETETLSTITEVAVHGELLHLRLRNPQGRLARVFVDPNTVILLRERPSSPLLTIPR